MSSRAANSVTRYWKGWYETEQTKSDDIFKDLASGEMRALDEKVEVCLVLGGSGFVEEDVLGIAP